jgi:hypothetical protein
MSNRLASLAFLAILIFVSLPAPLFAQSSPLTPDLLSKILSTIATFGVNRDIPAPLANPLGLSASGQNWPTRQIVTKDSGPVLLHSFAVDLGNQQDVAITARTSDSIHVFRARRDGKAVAAIIFDLTTHKITVRNPVEAQKELDAEFAYWADEFARANAPK